MFRGDIVLEGRNSLKIIERQVPAASLTSVHPVLARVYAARGVTSDAELELTLKRLLPWKDLKGIEQAVECLLPVVLEDKSLLVVGDFDVDGAASTALALRCLRLFGATKVNYLVPNRFDYGYGLSPELVKVAKDFQPDLIMTVDNGIASVAGVAKAKEYGIEVLVTDHHLPGQELPAARAIVNPNQPDCTFSSKAACGCTVVFYLMLALRARLLELGHFSAQNAPNMAQFLDLVALATVADVVPLDGNNRILVEQGLRRIRAGFAHAGIQALLQVAGRSAEKIVAADFGFAVGPRLNAAGRLDDMSLGIECLLTDDMARALSLAQTLDEMNKERRSIEQGMQYEAQKYLNDFQHSDDLPTGLVLYQADWHQGVIGILASRIKEKTHRPVIAMAADDSGLLKGSARSIAGLHIRDALDEVHKQAPYLMPKFGGHAMAAGLSLVADGLEEFRQRFDTVCKKYLAAEQLQHIVQTDGALLRHEFNLDLAQQLRLAGPWGQSFPEPVFTGNFEIISQRIVGEHHLKMLLRLAGSDLAMDAIWFNVDLNQWPDTEVAHVKLAYQLDINEYQGQQSVQLMVKGGVKLA